MTRGRAEKWDIGEGGLGVLLYSREEAKTTDRPQQETLLRPKRGTEVMEERKKEKLLAEEVACPKRGKRESGEQTEGRFSTKRGAKTRNL